MAQTPRQSQLWRLQRQLELEREDVHDTEILRLESLISEVHRRIAAERARGQ